MRSGWIILLVVLVAGSGCAATIDWKFLPRETPRMGVARFQGALAYGPKRDSFESLTEASRGVIGYTRWWLFMPYAKDPETDVKIMEIMRESAIDACYKTGETTAEVLTYYDKVKQAFSIKMVLEDGEWKFGMLETFMPDKVHEWNEEQRKKQAEKEDTPKPADP